MALIILDGFGVYKPYPGNAVRLAHTPNVARWDASFPRTEMAASGRDVGLPTGPMGNSEVGHLNLSAGGGDDLLLVKAYQPTRYADVATVLSVRLAR